MSVFKWLDRGVEVCLKVSENLSPGSLKSEGQILKN